MCKATDLLNDCLAIYQSSLELKLEFITRRKKAAAELESELPELKQHIQELEAALLKLKGS